MEGCMKLSRTACRYTCMTVLAMPLETSPISFRFSFWEYSFPVVAAKS